METLRRLYGDSLALLTDFYQLTMAYAFWKAGKTEQEAVFSLFFRENPFKSGFTIACGLERVIEFLARFHFSRSDIDYLAGLNGNDGRPLFEKAFLDFLQNMRFTCDIDAIPEGSVVFPYEPMIRVRGPIILCQLLETPLLNAINFQSLIATKAARICMAAEGDPVLEFGLRRAHGADGGISASRAAYIGGCTATSNVLAGKLYDIPVRGTHAHSWVMAFDSEPEAFKEYARAMPNNCVFLVDTYDTLEGVRHAIEMGTWLKENGHRMVGIRLDSGDLAYLSIKARAMLDEAGFQDAVIIASNDLDENIIASLKDQGARISVWGVGTKLATAYDQPALGGVYKLTALRNPGEKWQYKIKLSEQTMKISNPGLQQVRRFRAGTEFIGDAIYNEAEPIPEGDWLIVDPKDITRRKRISADTEYDDLLKPVFRNGELVYDIPDIHSVREYVKQELAGFHAGIKRFVNPHEYPVGLEKSLYDLKTRIVLKARGFNNHE